MASVRSTGIAISAALLLAGASLHAQTLTLQPGSGTQTEKFPTPRDPSYVPPLVPQSTLDSLNESDAGGSALIFGSGGGDLVSIFAERRRAQAEAARRADRYGERNAQLLDETGQDRVFIEQSVMRQFGTSRGLPRDFGKAHYTETPGRRFSVVFFLSLPITSAFVGGLYQLFGPGISVNGPADYPALFGVVGVGSLFSALIGYYDYSQTQALREHTAGHQAREVYQLRNNPFGPRGVKGDSATAPESENENARENEAGNQGEPVSDASDASWYNMQRAFRDAAETEARASLNQHARVTRSNPNDARNDAFGSRITFAWRFQL